MQAALFAQAESTLVNLAQRFAKRSVLLAFFGIPLELSTNDYHEEVNWRAMAIVKSKTVGVQRGDGLTMLPWETHCLPNWKPPEYKGVFTVRYLEPLEKARKLAVEIYHNQSGSCNIKELYAVLKEKEQALLSLDPSWRLEMSCLEYLIKSGAEVKLWQDIMGMMPSATRVVTPLEVLASMVEYESSHTFGFLPVNLRAILSACKGYVASVHRGLPPHQIDEATGNMKQFADKTSPEIAAYHTKKQDGLLVVLSLNTLLKTLPLGLSCLGGVA